MKKQTLPAVLAVSLILAISASAATVCDIKTRTCRQLKEPNDLDSVLAKLSENVNSLKSFSADIKYRHIQHVFESETVRTGKIYYKKAPENSKLRINFTSMLQDETARKDYREDILFDSVWLSRADHQNKSLVSQQVTTPEKPVEPFDLISRYFPIIGFTNSENLKSNFSLRLVKRKSPKAPIRLALIPEPNSPYKKDYRAIGLILDAETYLPADFSALTASGETIKIELTDIKKNKPIKPKTFELTVPKDYTVSKNPLK